MLSTQLFSDAGPTGALIPAKFLSLFSGLTSKAWRFCLLQDVGQLVSGDLWQNVGFTAATNNLTTFFSSRQRSVSSLCLTHTPTSPLEKYSNQSFTLHPMLTFLLQAYLKNLHTWSTTTTPPPKNPASGTRSTRARANRTTTLNSAQTYTPPVYQQPPLPPVPLIPAVPPNPPRPPVPTTQQALHSTYASRLRTGATLLMQPILPAASATTTRATTRRGGVVNYADPGSGDDLPDAGALDSDDSDFVASGGTRTSIRQTRTRMATGMSVFHSSTGVSPAPHSHPHPPPPPRPEKAELDQSYLGMVPPAKYIKSKPMTATAHEYP